MKLAAFLVVLAAPVSAQEFSLPAGCDAHLTVQSRSCEVHHYFRCAGDPHGEQSHVSLSEDGLDYIGTIDAEAQWVTSHHIRGEHSEELESNPRDRASFSELVATASDDYDFRTTSSEIGETRYVGRDTLTGKQVVIDGVTLDETSYDITAYAADGTKMWRSQGNEFISRDWRMFLSGKGTVTTPTDTYDTDGTPVQFIYPGEPGFLSIKPLFGCGVMMSSFEVTP
ncbi:MAG: hypothetical protein ACI91Z_001667 [Yoonia sp.]|jgi:hypothetical protein